MTQEHPIIPPPELVEQWYETANNSSKDVIQEVATQAARWGADQELEACCAIAVCNPVCGTKHQRSMLARHIRELRRPKLPSKKEALDELCISFDRGYLKKEAADIIRRALESLPE